MDAEQTRLARQLLGLNQTEFAALLGWTSKRNVVNLERDDKEVMKQTALAIECLLRRNNKLGEFEKGNKIMFSLVNKYENDYEYYKSLSAKDRQNVKDDMERAKYILQQIQVMVNQRYPEAGQQEGMKDRFVNANNLLLQP